MREGVERASCLRRLSNAPAAPAAQMVQTRSVEEDDERTRKTQGERIRNCASESTTRNSSSLLRKSCAGHNKHKLSHNQEATQADGENGRRPP